jgi:hypothetical protein
MSDNKWWHPVIIVAALHVEFLGRLAGDTYKNNTSGYVHLGATLTINDENEPRIIEAIDWCEKQFGLHEGWIDQTVYAEVDDNLYVRVKHFLFKKADDAMLFKLTWG